MAKIDYNMLVRDNYASILERTGKKKCTLDKVADEDFLNRLADKLEEEVASFSREFDSENDEKALNELADIMEVVNTIVNAYGLTSDAFARIQEARRAMYGAFDDKTLLVSIEDIDDNPNH